VGSFTDKSNEECKPDAPSAPVEQLQNSGRRQFSRSALVGSAVLLSLGNRAAWGGDQTVGCMSIATLNSFNPGKHDFISAPAGLRPGHNRPLADQIRSISSPPNYLGTDGTFSVCQDPNSIDGVCLVRSKNCPP
jgi:hypothetical protein